MNYSIQRRKILKGVAAATGGLFLPFYSVRGQSVAANERINIGLIGMGRQMGGLLSGLAQRDDTQVVAVCDVDRTRREHSQSRVNQLSADKVGAGTYKGCDAYNDFRELLARKDIDAVVIATPDHWHAVIASAAVRAGKDVYCEKPLTYNIAEAVALVTAVRATDRVFQVGSQQRSSREFRVAAELVRNGILGEVKALKTDFGDPAKFYDKPAQAIEPGLDWDLWCGPGPLVDYNEYLSPRGIHEHYPDWRMTREFGGGMITDWGAHHIDIAQWALGKDGSGPVEVRAPENWENAKRGAQLVYDNGAVLTHASTGKGLTVEGSEGTLHVSRGRFELILGGETKRKFWGKEESPGTSVEREVVLAEREYLANAQIKLQQSKGHQQDWLDAIRSRQRPICDVEIGASSVIACHLMNFGYYYGANMKWDPKANQIISGGDNKWLSRQDGRGDWQI